MISPQLQEVQVWLATKPIDMRKSFDGLAEQVRQFLKQDPLSGNLFVFRNRGGQLLKILWWDRNGLAIYYKRLERGAFAFPRLPEASHPSLQLSREELQRLLAGLSLYQRRAS